MDTKGTDRAFWRVVVGGVERALEGARPGWTRGEAATHASSVLGMAPTEVLAPGEAPRAELEAALDRILRSGRHEAAILDTLSLSTWREYMVETGWVFLTFGGTAELWDLPRDRGVVWAPWNRYGERSAYERSAILNGLARAEKRPRAEVLADLLRREERREERPAERRASSDEMAVRS